MPPRRRTRNVPEDSDEDERPRPRKNARAAAADEVDDTRHDQESDIEMEDDGPSAAESADQQLVKKMVRYALSCEYARQPIRRDGIKEKVLGNQGRSFRRIFELAQKQLRHIWGMELQELPIREKMSIQEKRKALNSTQTKTSSGSYILCSVLPAEYQDAKIIGPSRAPGFNAEATYTAFYGIVVSCIMLNGGELSDQKLRRYLARLNAEENVSTEKTETILKRMEKHGYIIKRIERPPVGQDGEHVIIWHVGGRGKEEIGAHGVMGMVTEVYGGSDADLQQKLRSSLGIKDPPPTEEQEEEAEETRLG